MSESLDDQLKVLVHRLEEGDMLVIRSPRMMSYEQARHIASRVEHVAAPVKARVLVLDNGLSLDVVRKLPGRTVNAPLERAGDDIISAFGSLEGAAG